MISYLTHLCNIFQLFETPSALQSKFETRARLYKVKVLPCINLVFPLQSKKEPKGSFCFGMDNKPTMNLADLRSKYAKVVDWDSKIKTNPVNY